MKVVILAGGLGTRLQEETVVKPKPMVEIGGYPVLWHIMNIYSHYGFNEFVVALGYKGNIIKDYFCHYFERASDMTVKIKSGEVNIHENNSEDWVVHLVDTGLNTMTGGRIKKLKKIIGDEPFMLTYGDGVADIKIDELVKFHQQQKSLATVTAVRPPSRFGGLKITDGKVEQFTEKPQIGEGWINGGFFVLQPEVIDYIDGDATLWEKEPLETLSRQNQLSAYLHGGFWQCMDTVRDVNLLQNLWDTGTAPWRVW
jgi:glucose-1-phosphate cytidylyltransferase